MKKRNEELSQRSTEKHREAQRSTKEAIVINFTSLWISVEPL